jgi:Acyl-CoA dehydrogenase, N-terminal domain
MGSSGSPHFSWNRWPQDPGWRGRALIEGVGKHDGKGLCQLGIWKETRDRKKVSPLAIDFTLSDSQQELQKNARAFAESVLRPVAGQIDRAADGWESFLAGRQAYREMAHAGFTKSFIPAGYGGAGFGMVDLAIAAEELTRVDVNVPTTAGHRAGAAACYPVRLAGAEGAVLAAVRR